MNTGNNKPKLGMKRGFPEDKRISVCTDCRYGIFHNRVPYMWTNRGLVHIPCEERRLNGFKNAS